MRRADIRRGRRRGMCGRWRCKVANGFSGRQELGPGSIPYPQASQQRIGKGITAKNIEVMNKVVVEKEKGVVALTTGARLRVGEKVRTSKLVMPGIYAARHHCAPDGICLIPISTGGVRHIFSEYQTYEVHKGQITGLVFTELRRRHPAMGQRSAISKFDDQHRSEEHTSELQSRPHLVCRLL